MALTIGKAPFSQKSAGTFNFNRDGPGAVLYWEDFPKRMRVTFNGETIADSRSMKALHETDRFMVLYFPREDVDMSYLEASDHQTECPHKGTASYWSVRVEDHTAKNAVWSYEDPVESAPPIGGYMAFVYDKMDAWYQEEEKVYAHPRDPYHRFDVHKSSRHVIVRHNGEVIAKSDHPKLLFETGLPIRYYLPKDDVRTELLQQSETVSQCPYKGDGQHWHLSVNSNTVEDAAWSLPDPLGEANKVAGCICFYPEKVDIKVDGEMLQE